MENKIKLTNEDFNQIIESLIYTKKAKEEYTGYPSYEFKLQQIAQTESLIKKVRKCIS